MNTQQKIGSSILSSKEAIGNILIPRSQFLAKLPSWYLYVK